MAIGDAAAAAGLAVYTSTQDRRLGYQNDNQRGDELAAYMIANQAALNGKQPLLAFAPVQQGTGVGQAPSGVVKIGYVVASGRVDVQVDATDFGNIRFETDGQFGSVPIYTPHGRANPATSGYAVAYLNNDGRLCVSASSRRFKKEIKAWTPDLQAVLALQVVTFRYKAAVYGSADAPVEVGLIAEDLDSLGLNWLVFYDDDGQPQGINYDRLALALLPVVQDHEARLAALEAKTS